MKKKKKNSFLEKNWLISDSSFFLEKLYNQFVHNDNISEEWKNEFKKIQNLSFLCKNKKTNNFLINRNDNYFKNCLINYKINLLINSIRSLGHYYSNLDPLNLYEKKTIPELSYYFYDISEEDLNKFINYDFLHFHKFNSSYYEVMCFFQKIYCGSIGFEYMHLQKESEKKWIQKKIEIDFLNFKLSNKKKKNILNKLIHAELFEKFIHKKFPGSKRFSLEGGESLIPMLNEVINFSINNNITKIFLGMSHRGRINVMHNILQEDLKSIFGKFLGKIKDNKITGDVKYHLGLEKDIFSRESKVKIQLLFNPSHLEIVTPVVLGVCRSKIDQYIKLNKSLSKILPIVIHGDASFIGQGVIQETLNMSKTPGYSVFGCLHIIINNQIGFTTSDTISLRSSTYCTDVSKMIDSPIFHVNSDDPEKVIFVINLALEFKLKFKKDVFIDLVCYRRLGHNEVDDPSITQPIIYKKIKKHPSVCKKYLNILIKNKTIDNLYYQNKSLLYTNTLQSNYNYSINKENKLIEEITKKKEKKTELYLFKNKDIIKDIKYVSRKLSELPKNFNIHYQVKKIFDYRKKIGEKNIKIDWGAAEILAYAMLIKNNISCRLTGEDVSRGTFSQRHAIIHCQETGKKYVPLTILNQKKNFFYVFDSVLSEESTLAFEFGYSIFSKKKITIWEAQFGDFSNSAQIVIDQFISSSYQKWGFYSSLVLFLPHGQEGQGPEHSSGRIERFLQLCAQKNMVVCIPSTPAQMYHKIYLQGLGLNKKPLIIFTPKSLLRNVNSFSNIEDISLKSFQKIILKEIGNCNSINRIIFCSGKIYYDLELYAKINKKKGICIVRIEELYPFPKTEIKNIFKSYNLNCKYIWCQEEPKNQGAWIFVYHYFLKIIDFSLKKNIIHYIGRKKYSSTADGDYSSYQKIQKKILHNALYK